MTGFARAAGADGDPGGGYRWTWEIRTVNAKGLDVRFRAPPGHDALEFDIRKRVQAGIARGTVHIQLELSRALESGLAVIHEERVRALAQRLRALASDLGLPPPGLEAILALPGVVDAMAGGDEAAARAALAPALLTDFDRALAALLLAREGEGAALSRILADRVEAMRRAIDAAELAAAEQGAGVQERLRQAVAALAGTDSALDPARLHQEALVLALKADVREEIDRFRAHLAAIDGAMAEAGAVGRRLDFLAQELSREANTLCAKASDLRLTAIGLTLKQLVEQFREQVQNVE
jgi:uncharacterized protein (TIGR00255 family)